MITVAVVRVEEDAATTFTETPTHLSYVCPSRDESDDDQRGSRGNSDSDRRRRDHQPRKEKLASSKTPSKSEGDTSSGKEASCSMVGVVEPTILLALEAREDIQAVAIAVKANPTVVLLDSGFSHHLMGTREAFVDMKPGSKTRHVRGFNGALQNVEGRDTAALKGETGKQILIPDVFYVLGVQTNLLLSGQLKDSGVMLQDEGDKMLLVSAAGDVLGRARFTSQVLCTDLRPCPLKAPEARARWH
ncbi:unnamed protein product [Closterium sp. NIES-53]